jgi:ABC-2 type transport system permease protein
MFIAAPLYFLFSFIVFFYCLGALYDERRDRSILFWKSLPISDGLTVLSKVAMAAVVAPLITIAIATVSSLFLLFVFSVALATKGIHVFGAVLSSPSLYLAPVQLAGLVPVYLLWALPTIGWLLMVSSWARSKAFLWAVGAPLMSLALLSGANSLFQFHWNTAWYAENIVARGLLGLVPGGWFSFAGIDREHLSHHAATTEIFTQSWATLASPHLWAGAVAGAAMIYVAVTMRRWREES